ncbi:hypothetical protein AGMMS50230_19470 [Spirochaetia bacterium]|nr:hypothetical protein AGMMS50230_19470 [Spirochaetia bacterium]
MNLPKAKSTKKGVQEQQAENERIRREVNAKKAKDFASKEYPGEKWSNPEPGIFVSEHQGRDKKILEKELVSARILKSKGSTVYILPENSRNQTKKVDAIVNGDYMELKTVIGGLNSVQKRFLESREQSRNVFINVTSNLERRKVINQIAGARQGPQYGKYNRFKGGKIIIKLKDRENLIYLNVDSLKWEK